jgi:hypothetical protein
VPPGLVAFLTTVFDDDDWILVRPVETWTDPDGRKACQVNYHEVKHITARWFITKGGTWWKALNQMAEVKHANLFFGVCPRFGSAETYDLAWQIRTVRVLWADLDHITTAEAFGRCNEAALPPPSVVVRSGNGVHLYWLLDKPYLIGDAGDPPPVKKEFIEQGTGMKKLVRKYVVINGENVYEHIGAGKQKTRNPFFPTLSEKAKQIQHILAGMASKIGGDHATDLARLLRLPNTMNRKDGRNGKPPAPCTLEECHPERRYPLAVFQQFADFAPDKMLSEKLAKLRMPSGTKLTPAKRNQLADYINACHTTEDRSKADFALCCFAIRQGYDAELIWAEVQDVGKFAQRGKTYFDLTWGNADRAVRKRTYERIHRQAGATASPRQPRFGDLADNTPRLTDSGDGTPNDSDETCVEPDPGELPSIIVSGRQLSELTEECLEAIHQKNRRKPYLFQRGGMLTRIRIDPEHDSPKLEALNAPAIRGELARAARYAVETKQGIIDTFIPTDVAQDVLSLAGYPNIPLLTAITEIPVFACNGRLVDQPGYNPHAHVWYHAASGLAMPAVNQNPTQKEIVEARAWFLDELFCDFPFADEASAANVMAAMLLPFVRHMIDGPTPLHIFDAPVEGTGKTLLINAICRVSTGRNAEAASEGQSDEEWRKRITSILVEGPTFILLDNINRYLDSGALASALTATTWRDRILGFTKMATVPNTAVWFASGNNIRMSRELIRRALWIRLDSKTETPWTRTGFKHPNLSAWAKENRGKLMWAALTLCQAWIAANRPPGNQTLGMFEEWAATMGGILDTAEIPGLLTNAAKFREAATDETSEWKAFILAWWSVFADQPKGVKDLYQLATKHTLLDRVLGDKGERSQRTRLGLQLSKKRDQIIADYRIVENDENHNACKTYSLEPTKPSGDPALTEFEISG